MVTEGSLRCTLSFGAAMKAQPSELQTYVVFRSDRFPACEGEEKLVNPGLWGRRLADFLRDRLRAEGFEAKDPSAEDWGWRLPIGNEQFGLWIGCGNYQEYPDGFLCFIEPHKPVVRKFFRTLDTRPSVSGLQRALDKILVESAGIREKRWWTHGEFNRLAR